jgi:hydroxymethylglutaryl-CoA lyase
MKVNDPRPEAETETAAIELVEVGARDGLQNEKELILTADKVGLITRCIEAGARRLEVASFVNPRRVPQMADAEDVIAALPARPDVTYIGLVLNERGAERALATSVQELGAVAIASDGFGIRNQNQTSAQSVDVASRIIAMARAEGRSAQVTISVAFGCPFDGEVDPAHVVAMVAALAEASPREIALADTIGAAGPGQVMALVNAARQAAGEIPLRLHFHNTRNSGLANAWAGYMAGVRIFDASLGGLGGCPFAPKATGNIPTEDLIYMMERSGVRAGMDLDRLIETANWFTGVMGRPLPSMVSRAGNYPPAELVRA